MMKSNKKVTHAYLFKYLLLANFLQYLEAGAVPALLLSLSNSFEMNSGQQGLLGGVVYLSLGIGGPIAGYLLHMNNHKTIVVTSVACNMIFTLLWAMTPVGYTYSSYIFIALRFFMGLCQSIVCVFLPLWTNQNAPKETRTSWMSYLQASVPLGVMMGYIIASISISLSQNSTVCLHLLCWRWPFLVEIILLVPLYSLLYFVPSDHLAISSFQSNSNIDNASSLDKSDNSIEMTPIDHDLKEPLDELNESTVEKIRRNSLRRHSISASLFDPLSLRDVIKRSYDNIAELASVDDFFALLPGFSWNDKKKMNPLISDFENSEGKLLGEAIDTDQLVSKGLVKEYGSIHNGGSRPVLNKSSPLNSISSSSFSTKRKNLKFQIEEPIIKYESLKDVRKLSHKASKEKLIDQNGSKSTTNSPLANKIYYNSFYLDPYTHDDEIEAQFIEIDRPNESIDVSDSKTSDEFMKSIYVLSESEIDSDSEDEASFLASSSLQYSEFTSSSSSNDISPYKSYFHSIMKLLSNGVYRNLLGALTALYFTVTGIQFWGTKYLSIALQAPLNIVSGLFIICAATGPTFGVFFGGKLVDFVGGYKGLNQRILALEICSGLGLFAFLCAIPITFVNNLYYAVILLWLVLFFGGSILPACSGILVSLVPRTFRTYSSSLSLVIFNLCGYFLSLILSGYVMQVLESNSFDCSEICSMVWGFRIILFGSSFAVIFLLSSLFEAKRLRAHKAQQNIISTPIETLML